MDHLHSALAHLTIRSPNNTSSAPSPQKPSNNHYHDSNSAIPSGRVSPAATPHQNLSINNSIANTPMYSHAPSHSNTTTTSPNRSLPMSLMTTPTMSQGTTPGQSPRRDEEEYQPYASSSSSSPDSPVSTPQPHPDRMMVRLLIDAKFSGSLIGKGGHIINQLRVDTEASIDIADAVRGAEHRLVTIKGSAPRTAQAILSISQRLAERRREQRRQDAQALAYGGDPLPDLDDNRINITLLVPNSQVGCLIGRSGASIKSTRETSGATIRVSDQVLDGSAEKSVFVDGSVTQVTLALDLICAQLYEARERAITRQLYQPRPQPHSQQQHQQQQHMGFDPYHHALPMDPYPMSSLPQLQMPQLQSLAQSTHHGHGHAHGPTHGHGHALSQGLTHPAAHHLTNMQTLSQMPPATTMNPHHLGATFASHPHSHPHPHPHPHPHSAVGMPPLSSQYQAAGLPSVNVAAGVLPGYMSHPVGPTNVAVNATNAGATSTTTSLSADGERMETISFSITNEFVGAILGRGGAVIREIRARTPSHIRVSDPHPHTFERMVTVTGTKQNNEMAMALIQEKINQHEPQRSRRV